MRRCVACAGVGDIGAIPSGQRPSSRDDRGVNDGLKVVVADDAVLLRDGLASLLERAGHDDHRPCGGRDGADARVQLTQPDVAVIDIKMPPTHTDEGLVAAERSAPSTRPPACSCCRSTSTSATRCACSSSTRRGVGYLLKERVSDSGVVVDAVRRVAAGECIVDPTIVSHLLRPTATRPALGDLTEREREVLALVAEGLEQGNQRALVPQPEDGRGQHPSDLHEARPARRSGRAPPRARRAGLPASVRCQDAAPGSRPPGVLACGRRDRGRCARARGRGGFARHSSASTAPRRT